MNTPLHILHLEPDRKDARLVRAAPDAGQIDYTLERVENRADFVAALERNHVDLVLSDFKLPAFDGLSALEIVHTKWPALPFILVLKTPGEEPAIESFKPHPPATLTRKVREMSDAP